MFHVYRREMLKLFMIITRTVLQCFIYGHFFYRIFKEIKCHILYTKCIVQYRNHLSCTVQYMMDCH